MPRCLKHWSRWCQQAFFLLVAVLLFLRGRVERSRESDEDLKHSLWLMRLSYLRYALKAAPNAREMLEHESEEMRLGSEFTTSTLAASESRNGCANWKHRGPQKQSSAKEERQRTNAARATRP